jgi:PAS domain S-box-containing protein
MEPSIKSNEEPGDEKTAARDQRWALRAFTASPAAMAITRLADDRILEVNQSFLDMFGFERNEVVGRSSAELGLWVDRPAREAMDADFIAGTPVRNVAGAFRRKNGELGFGLGSFEPIEIDGQPCILTVAQDITNARRTRDAFRLNERRFRSLVMASAQIVWSGDPRGLPLSARGITDVQSHSWSGFTGQTPEQMQGHGWEDAVHPEDRARMHADFRAAYANKSVYQTEYRVRRSDGVYRLFSVRGIPAITPDGEIEEWFGAMTDITDQRHAERELARANVAAWLMADVSAAASLDLEFRPTMRRVAQATVPNFAHLCLLDCLDDGSLRRIAVAPPDADKALIQALEGVPPDMDDANDLTSRVIASARPLFFPALTGAELSMFARNEPHLAALRGLDLRSAICVPLCTTGDAFGAITFYRTGSDPRFDETDLSLAQELGRRIALSIENARLYTEAREAESRLREANRVKDEFLGMMSHELRTPITVVRGGARVLMLRGDQMDREARTELIADIEQESARLARMLDDLLALSRLELDQRPDLEPVLLSHLIPELVQGQGNAALVARTELVIGDDLPIVQGDPGYIGHVLGNILSNAFKYSPPGSPIEVRLERADQGVAVRVIDSGVGLAPEDLDHVFERFYRSDRTAGLAGGAGMGLAVCKRLVEAMSGEIWVIPRETQGLEVGFSLPLAEPENTADPA